MTLLLRFCWFFLSFGSPFCESDESGADCDITEKVFLTLASDVVGWQTSSIRRECELSKVSAVVSLLYFEVYLRTQ